MKKKSLVGLTPYAPLPFHHSSIHFFLEKVESETFEKGEKVKIVARAANSCPTQIGPDPTLVIIVK